MIVPTKKRKIAHESRRMMNCCTAYFVAARAARCGYSVVVKRRMKEG
jgi:hypothetical protein